MKQNSDSDFNPAMLANNAFETLIDQVRNSNLNFQLQMSPFSAQISLKKSLVIDQAGRPRLPPTIEAVKGCFNSCPGSDDVSTFVDKNIQLEKALDNLKIENALTVDDCDKAHAKIKYLEAELARISIKQENFNPEEIETLQDKVSELTFENLKYKETFRLQTKEINELKSSLKVKNDTSNQLNKKLNELKIRVEQDLGLKCSAWKRLWS